MYGLAGARSTPGMPHLDGLDAHARQREREARKAIKGRKKDFDMCAKKHVRTKAQLRDKGHITHG
jgi:hypothetical protein